MYPKRYRSRIKTYENHVVHTQTSSGCDINPLALPRGTVLYCEICRQKCWFLCKRCKTAFYCCEGHRDMHYGIIHKHVCDRMEFLHRPKHPTNNTERMLLTKQETIVRKEIAEEAKNMAIASMCQDQNEDAVIQLSTAFVHEDKFEPGGCESLRRMRIHTLFTEAYIKLGDMLSAENHLQKAQFILNQQDKNCADEARPHFYKVEGLYKKACSNIPEAIYSFSNEVFYAVKVFHTKHPRFAAGLFHLGQSFVEQEKYSLALSHFMHAIDIWTFQIHQIILHFLETFDDRYEHDNALRSFVLKEKTDKGIFSNEDKKDLKEAMLYLTNDGLAESLGMSCLHKIQVECAFGMTQYIHGHYKQASDIAMKCKLQYFEESLNPHGYMMAKKLYTASNKQMKRRKGLGLVKKNQKATSQQTSVKTSESSMYTPAM